MKNSKTRGFTLIELLAIIVILAIIAVITVPIILNVIENAKKGAAIDSVYGYKDAVSKYYVSNMIDNQDISLNGFYLIEDGTLKRGNEDPVEISFSGTAPSEGNLVINKGSVEAGCMILDDYKITILNGKVSATEKGKCYGIPVYYDVSNGEKCDATSNNDGCMKWYIYDADESTYTMILDHNLELEDSSTVAWISQDDYNQTKSKTATPSEVGVEYLSNDLPTGTWRSEYGTNNRGPITVLNKLKISTDDWKGIEIPVNYTAEWDECTSCSNYYTGKQQYTINYSDYKAKLISAEEIAQITGNTNWILSNGAFYFDTSCQNQDTCSAGQNKYGWLFDNLGSNEGSYNCTQYGCKTGINSDPYGYWTSSPNARAAYSTWHVNYDGYLGSHAVGSVTRYGIRPVITISKSMLSLE